MILSGRGGVRSMSIVDVVRCVLDGAVKSGSIEKDEKSKCWTLEVGKQVEVVEAAELESHSAEGVFDWYHRLGHRFFFSSSIHLQAIPYCPHSWIQLLTVASAEQVIEAIPIPRPDSLRLVA